MVSLFRFRQLREWSGEQALGGNISTETRRKKCEFGVAGIDVIKWS